MLSHLPCKHMLDMPCSGQPDNMPEVPCLGLRPPQHLSSWEEFSSQRVSFSNTNQPIHSPQPQPPFLFPTYSKPLYICFNHPRPRNQTLRTHPMSHSPVKLFALANPKPADPVSPIPPCGNRSKGSCSQFPSPLCLKTSSNASPGGLPMAYVLPSETVSNNLSSY